MTDWTKSTGNAGTMMIRDTGTIVEFWLKASSDTYMEELPWGFTVNGSTDNSRTFNFSSTDAYQKLGSFSVKTSQTVTFRLFATGTWGLGGPTTFTHDIVRTAPLPPASSATAPPKPNPWRIEYIEDVKVRGDTDGNDDGGSPITRWQVGYGQDSSVAKNFQDVDENGYGWVTGLYPDTVYYFWVRAYNSKGWSAWSNRTSARTHTIPDAPSSPVLSDISQTSVKYAFTPNYDGGSKVIEWQVGYGTSSTNAQFYSSLYSTTISGLDAGGTYYFWARGRNKYGWSLWSKPTKVVLLGSAWVDVNGVKKRAVPYVNVNGVWKQATVYVKIGGLWEGTG